MTTWLKRIRDKAGHWSQIITILLALTGLYLSLQQRYDAKQASIDTQAALNQQARALALQGQALKQAREKLEDDHQIKALDQSMRYDEIMDNLTHDHSWLEQAAIDVADYIYELRGEEWRPTVVDMIDEHLAYLRKYHLSCTQYDPKFIEMVKERVPEVCDPLRRAHSGKVKTLSKRER